MKDTPSINKTALVFGASSEQGRSVLEGLVDGGFRPIYGVTSNPDAVHDQYLSDALQCTILEGCLSNPADIRKALVSTKAQTIFLATATDIPADGGDGVSYQFAQDEEYECIVNFFDVLKQVYAEDGMARTIVFSTQDDVQDICRQHLAKTGTSLMDPLDDGCIVPHFSAKGKGGRVGLEMLKDAPDLRLVLITPAFFYSNFLAFFAPLPNEGRTQWQLKASFGNGATKIDMMNTSDLGRIVVRVIEDVDKYDGFNLRIASEKISMDEIAAKFSDLYGKDVIYNPLLPTELAALDFETAPVQAQMCQYLAAKGTVLNLEHDVELTEQIMAPKMPSKFSAWLLTHSDAASFVRVGLDLDMPEISKICVFGALSPQGQSVVKGILADTRKSYQIRCTTRRDLNSFEVQQTIRLDPGRVSFVQVDYDNLESCRIAANGMDGAFLAADLQETPVRDTSDLDREEQHARNIIDACEGQVRHLVISTIEESEKINEYHPHRELLELSLTARMAAYARSKNLSMTFVLMPCYAETFFDILDVRFDDDGNEKVVLRLPATNGQKMMCMSVDELGPAVASIFDSYQCYAGHEIGLVTDFVTVSEVQNIFQDAFSEHTVETETIDTKDWIQATGTYMKDMGQLFAGISDSQAISSRHSIASTLKLVPSASNLKRWVEENGNNPAFREKLGLR